MTGEPTTTATDRLRRSRDQLLALRTDYAAALDDFGWPDVGDTFNFAHDWFDVFARGNHDPGLVIVEEDGSRASYTFDELAHRSDQVGSLIAGTGVGRGDSVIIMLGNQVELWESMLGLIKIGAVLMPTTTAAGPAELADRIDRGNARAVICGVADTGKFADLPGDYTKIVVGGDVAGWLRLDSAYDIAEPRLDHPGNASTDRLLLYFTSGTTSRPKLVEHTHISYPVGHLTTMYWLGLKPGDLHLNISSPGWAKHAWSNFFAPLLAESGVLVYNYARFDPEALLARLTDEAVTSFCAPPTVWRMLINADLAGGKPAALRETLGAGEPLNPEVISRVEQHWGLTIRDGFGQTECTATVANSPGQPLKAGSMGRPLPGLAVVLVDPLTGEVVDGVGEGEICLDLNGPGGRPVSLMTGYQGDAERNAQAMAGGFYHTGDLAERDDQGYLTYIGRTDDVFKASDYKVSPFELESVLIEHPAVAEAAIVPAPDEIRLAVPKAYVALAPNYEPSAELARDILMYAREHLPTHLRVRRLEFFDLPKTISGKIRRVELRRREDDHRDGAIEGEYRDADLGVRGS